MWQYIFTLCIFALTNLLYHKLSGSEEIAAIEFPEDFVAVTPTQDFNADSEDKYLEAYVQGLIDSKYARYHVIATVRNGTVVLSNLPKDSIKANKIITFLKKFTSVPGAAKDTEITIAAVPEIQEKLATQNDHHGIWLPQSTVLFPTQVANPRQLCFSVGHRFNDICGGHNASAVTFGDQFPMYRWSNIWKWKGDLQLELEAGVFAVFCHDTSSSPLQNADYYVGIPLTYATGPWAFRGRIYHISSHLGDEYMQQHPHCHRKNKSYEAVDFFTSYRLTKDITILGGPGVIVHSDSEMRLKPLYAEYGAEIRSFRHNFTQLYGQPFISMYFRNYQEENFRFDSTYAIGYEWGKIHGFGRKIRLFAEYHDGYSPDGQFSKYRTHYFALRLSYGF